MAREKRSHDDFPCVLASYASPLNREPGKPRTKLQAGKEHNVALASSKIDGIVLRPGRTFSYHHAIGRPSLLRGFRRGLELHGGAMSEGVGGGCCQVSNMLLLLAIRAGLEIVERHRHALDLFPDHGRTVPFGCGATVFYNSADLRVRNPLSFPVQLRIGVRGENLVGEVATSYHPGWRAEEFETDHQFSKEGNVWIRENRVWRRFLDSEGNVLREEELFHNIGRCLYEPEDRQ